MANELKNFQEETLLDAMFGRLGDLLTDFVPDGRGGWMSELKIDGSRGRSGRADKTVVKATHPHRAIQNDEDFRACNLLDLWMLRKKMDTHDGGQWSEAVRKVAMALGMTPPEGLDAEALRAVEEKQRRLEDIAQRAAYDLYDPDLPSAVEVLKYLRDDRGYGDGFIKWAGLGYIKPSLAVKLLRECEGVRVDQRIPSGTPAVAIPYRTGRGRIVGFAFRMVEDLVGEILDKTLKPKAKYYDIFTSPSVSKGHCLFGVRGLSLDGKTDDERREVVFVEGELDALRCAYEGVRNVCAMSAGGVSRDALRELRSQGVERVVLLLDHEGDPKKKSAAITAAADAVREEGLTPLVSAFYPSDLEPDTDRPKDAANTDDDTAPSDGDQPEAAVKMDADTYLKDHTGAELQTLIDTAMDAGVYEFNRLERGRHDGGGRTARNDDVFRRNTLRICHKVRSIPTSRAAVAEAYHAATGGSVSVSDMLEAADDFDAEEARKDQTRKTRKMLQDALQSLDEEGSETVIAKVLNAGAELRGASLADRFAAMVRVRQTEERLASWKSRPEGLDTPYMFKSDYGEERLVIPSGAITFVCAPTSHGKSRFCQNLALLLAESPQGDGDVLYLSFEEDRDAVEVEMFNIMANMRISNNNLRTLHTYYRTGDITFASGGTETAKRDLLEQFNRSGERFHGMLNAGKVRVIYEDLDAVELVEFIRFAARNLRVKAVFIDHIQQVYKRGSTGTRKDELREICSALMKAAVETRLPLVVAAQMNRDTLSPIEMSVHNISDATEIEQCANVAILLWNSNVKARPKSIWSGTKTEMKKGVAAQKVVFHPDALALMRRGLTLGQDGHLYAVLAKNRGGVRNADAVLKFDTNTGLISPEVSMAEDVAECSEADAAGEAKAAKKSKPSPKPKAYTGKETAEPYNEDDEL